MTVPQPPQQSVVQNLDSVNREPSEVEVNVLVSLFNQGRYSEGETLARELTIRLPHHGFGWKVLGALLKSQGANDEALKAMRKAAEFSPADEEVQNNLGALLGEINNWLEAEAYCRRALAINANFAEAHFNLGNAYQALGRFSEAEACFMRTLVLKPDYIVALFNLSMLLKEQGRLAEAESSYRKLLRIKPDYVEAHNNLGVLFHEEGRLQEAEVHFRYALEAKPDYVGAHNNLGNCLKDQGHFSEAEASYQSALVFKPDQAEVHNHLGIIFKETGRVADAVASYRRAIAINPHYAAAYNNLGIALGEQCCFSEAEVCYRRALEISPDLPEVFFNLGKLLQEQNRYAEAEANYLRALTIKPDYADAHNNLGNILRDQNQLVESEASYRRALQVNPDYAEAHNNLGITLHAQDRFSEAEASYLRALEIKPNFAEAFCNLGNTHKEQGRFADAEVCFRRALELKPDYAEAYYNMGNLHKDQGHFAQAEAGYRQALKIKPDFPDARSNLLFTLNYNASHAPAYCLDEARQYGRMLERRTGKCFSTWSCSSQPERLRIGMVSADLRNHPVGYFLEGLLSHIDPMRIELIAYPSQRKDDELTARIRPCFSTWKPIGQNDAAAATAIHSDGVHVLIDLSGHTANNRLPLFRLRPAPVQVSWLGYFATTGVAEMNYLLGDPYVTPIAEENHFSETVYRLPESYLCFTPPDSAVDVMPLPALSTGMITFGCFNNLTKMSDDVVALWARVLRTVPGSRLFLKTKQLSDLSMREVTCRRFAAHGITADKLILEGGAPRADLLKAYHRVDIALDPFPYPGGTTSVEGLWMGVPAITLKGDRFLSHVGESIAHNAGLADWIAADADAYVAKAVEHTSNLERLTSLRAGLRQQVLASPLFDAPRFARHFEDALWSMWQRWQLAQGVLA
ncbi:MAG TPA: tetratricopeptide repeat protein [Burkholderiaceae bacterium]|jgi:predicted O-linked N-acetylglucosamine transferase (SPINDLY family)